MLLASIGILLLVGLLILAATLHVGDRSGARIDAEEHTSIIRSPNWNSDRHRFDNKLKRIDGSFFEMSRKYFFGGSTYRQPSTPINTASLTADSFAPMPPNDLRVTWFGHSSFLIEIESLNVLIDPVWGERASPFTFAGPKRFFPPVIEISELPEIDVVLISHDHYDHLDYETVHALKDRNLSGSSPWGWEHI